jgi:pimeloyl-ACP methyl ester carboxylesterase
MSTDIADAESYVPVPGGTLFVKSWARGATHDKSPILLLHDSLGCVEAWRMFPEKLSERTNRIVVAYDRLGFGKSSTREELPKLNFIQQEAEVFLPALAKSLGLERFTVYGHSVGGAMGVAFAAAQPEMCESLITEAAQVYVEEGTRRGIQLAQVLFQRPEVFAKLVKLHGDKAQWVLDAWTRVWLSYEFEGWSLRDELSKVRCPLMAIHGDRDEFGSEAFPELLCELSKGPATKHILTNCGHIPHREHFDTVLILVDDFLKP